MTSQSRFCPRLVVRDSDTQHGPGDQGQFMGRDRAQILIHGAASEEVTSRNICAQPAGPPNVPPTGLRMWRARERLAGCCEFWPNFRPSLSLHCQAFFSTQKHVTSVHTGQRPARSWCAAGQACPSGGFMSSAGIATPPHTHTHSGRGQGGGRERVWNTLRRPRGQLVNFVGMHLVERRCINIRSLSVYCVSHSGGGGGPVGHRCLSSSRQGWLVGVLRRSLLARGQS